MFFQLTGVIVLAFFAPLVFRTVGFGSNAALMGAVINGAVNIGALLLSTLVIDRYGRKVLFMAGGIQMVIAQVLFPEQHTQILYVLFFSIFLSEFLSFFLDS